MPNILVRNIDPEKLERLKARAKQNGRSLQSEAKLVLEDAAAERRIDDILKAARLWRKKVGRPAVDSASLVREDRER
jgi:plasmid stability protein